jgi:phosphotransferase system HPr (HPr) family protein
MELRRSIEVSNKYGLHARTSTRFSQVARRFRSAIHLSREPSAEEVDAKSILGILTLGAARGEKLRLRVVGDDAEEAMTALVELMALFEQEDEELYRDDEKE